jgi:hypothetical protein
MAAELITAGTSPVATRGADCDRQLGDLSRLVGGDLVLHLHRLDDRDQRALVDHRPRFDGDPQHRVLDRRDERVGASAGTAPFTDAAAGAPITLTSKRLPETSTM